MRLAQLIKKTLLRVKSKGLRDTLKEAVHFRRVMVAIEQDIEAKPSPMSRRMHRIIVDQSNIRGYRKVPAIKNVRHFCKRGAQSLLLYEDGELAGYQIWTFDKNFIDLRKLDIRMSDDEAYLFDLFVFPRFRATQLTRTLVNETCNYLVSCGVRKIYGFFFEDSAEALLWRQAFPKGREIRKVRTNRLLFVEITGKKLSFRL